MNVKLSSSFWSLRQKHKLRSQKTVPKGYAKHNSPNRFYLTFPRDNS